MRLMGLPFLFRIMLSVVGWVRGRPTSIQTFKFSFALLPRGIRRCLLPLPIGVSHSLSRSSLPLPLLLGTQPLPLELIFQVNDTYNKKREPSNSSLLIFRFFLILPQQREHHSRPKVLACGVLQGRAVEQHEQGARFNLVGLRDAAECLHKGGQVAGELRADAGVCKQGALLQEFLVHLVGGGSAEAEGLHQSFRVQTAGTVESFRCGKRDAGFFV